MAAPRLATWGNAHGRAAITPLFEGSVVALGAFSCDPADPLWERENCIGDGPHVVFPSTAVRLTLDGQRACAAEPGRHAAAAAPGGSAPPRRVRQGAARCALRAAADARGDRSRGALLPRSTSPARSGATRATRCTSTARSCVCAASRAGSTEGENLGFDVVGIGDADGDGSGDLLVSAAEGDTVYVIAGEPLA